MCSGICELAVSGAAPEAAPQTFETAVRQFRRQILDQKKQPRLAGQIERLIQQHSKPLLREAARESLQTQADACPPRCPVCGAPLQHVERRERTILTQWGEVTLCRAYGRCPACQQNFAPADHALGLDKSGQTSPDLTEKLTYLATFVPPGQAAEVYEHLTGQRVAPARVERQAKKKGTQALLERGQDVARALEPATRADFSRETRPADEPEAFTLVLMMDGWMIRERDDWGLSQALRRQGADPSRWHEVKSARLFRLDQRASTQSQRPILLSSHVIATRGDAAAFGERVFTEAVRWGALRAQQVLVVADGGAWIWNIIKDRFSWAGQTLDFFHLSQHLWTVAHALFGEAAPQARKWVAPLLHRLRHGQEGRVVKTLVDLAQKGREQKLEIAPVLAREAAYLDGHRAHLDYQAKAERGEPIGSGAMESACKQYQLRFKRPGQFWEQEEGLLELYSRRLSGRWDSLWPHLISQN